MREIKVYVLIAIMCISFLSLCMGITVATNKGNCEYHTLSQVLNPGYILGCELARKRF